MNQLENEHNLEMDSDSWDFETYSEKRVSIVLVV